MKKNKLSKVLGLLLAFSLLYIPGLSINSHNVNAFSTRQIISKYPQFFGRINLDAILREEPYRNYRVRLKKIFLDRDDNVNFVIFFRYLLDNFSDANVDRLNVAVASRDKEDIRIDLEISKELDKIMKLSLKTAKFKLTEEKLRFIRTQIDADSHSPRKKGKKYKTKKVKTEMRDLDMKDIDFTQDFCDDDDYIYDDCI